ncbi:MAG: RluA family pseudouridine synthase [Betaproteobacteria bacterium]
MNYKSEHIELEIKELQIPLQYADTRVDVALTKMLPKFSRNQIQQWLDSGEILIDGKQLSAKHRIVGGEQVRINLTRSTDRTSFTPENIPLDIIFEDEEIIVLNKPDNLVVHPAAGNWSGTVLNAILAKSPSNKSLPRAGIVHRLDKDTTGLMIVAKTLSAQTNLVRQLQSRSVKREYKALVYGQIVSSIVIDKPIGRHPKNRKLMCVNETGKPAVTHLIPEELGSGWSLVKCQLETGRTHQIRVHLKSIHHPIIGDQAYLATKYQKGKVGVVSTINRQALHAVKLEIIHPALEKPMQWEIDPPRDFQDTLEYLRAQH